MMKSISNTTRQIALVILLLILVVIMATCQGKVRGNQLYLFCQIWQFWRYLAWRSPTLVNNHPGNCAFSIQLRSLSRE